MNPKKDVALIWKDLPIQQGDANLRKEVLKKLILQFVQELYFGKREYEELIEEQILKIESLFFQASD
ncbi:hypothetical protein [Leptospira stimsonii]|uniref:hypothetical protein n=1 Tax=Leptospira stimsonii TaxID=2202203 RepID=UPI00157FB099|nr:hypothetical protein [Leptospira stimsonii]